MSVLHVILMICMVPWVASNTVLGTSTPASSESVTGLHIVESHSDSVEEESSVVTRLGRDFAALVMPVVKERDMRSQLTIRMVDPLSELSTDVNNSGCISRKRKVEETSQRSVRPKYCSSGSMPEDSLAFRNAHTEAANAVNTSTNRFVKEEIDDNGDLPEENRALDKKIKKKYIWAHAGISSCIGRNNLFHSQSGKIPVCFITATHEEGVVRLRAECLVGYENWTVKKTPMRNIMEEAADVWTEPSAKITDLIEQFKSESAFFIEKRNDWYKTVSLHEGETFISRQMLKIAKIYGEMHPESNYSHVHVYYNFKNYCILVHP